MRWKITVNVWPHSTGRGQDIDQAAAGAREQSFTIDGDEFAAAYKAAKFIVVGIEASPARLESPD